MNPTTVYCRLCAGLKQRNSLINLHIDEDLCQNVITKLERFHITMDFQDNILPKTVCLLCIKSLEQAFKFISAVEEAQAFLSDFVMVQCLERKFEEDSISYELVGSSNCPPSPLEGNATEIDMEDCYSNDQVKCENDDNDDSNDQDFKLEYESEGSKSVDQQITPIIDKPDNHLSNNTNINITSHEDITNHDINAICQDIDTDEFDKTNIKTTSHEDNLDNITNHDINAISQDIDTDEFDTNVSEVVENQQNTTKRKIIKKNNTLKKSDATPKKNNEIKTVQDMENYSNDEINELIEKLDDVPVQYITKTWQDITWHCSHCETQFTSMETLQKHCMEVHNSCNSYKCSDCPTRRSNLKIFLTHLRRHHKYLHYSCYKCYRKFPNMASTVKHFAKSHKLPNKCLGCYNTFPTKEQLKEHTDKYKKKICDFKKYNHLKKDNTCYVCHKPYNSYESLKSHYVTHHTYVCDTCGKSCNNKHNLIYHIATHNPEIFQCEICERSFKTRRGIQRHVDQHRSEEAPGPLEGVREPTEIDMEDCYSNDDSNNHDFNLENENEGTESVDQQIKPIFNTPDNYLSNNTNINTSSQEDITNHDINTICQDINTDEFDTNVSEVVENQQNTTKRKIIKKNNTLKKSVATPKKNNEIKTVPDMENYSQDDINELIEKLGYVPVQYITKTWQDITWHCSHCETQFTSMETLQKHSMEVHNSCNSYKCGDCTTRTSSLKIFLTHLRKHYKYLHYSCYKCYRKFPNMAGTVKHRFHTHNCPNKCLGCYNTFSTKEQLKEHTDKYYKKILDFKKYNHLKKDNTCHVCHKPYNRYQSLKNHYVTHHTEVTTYVCDTCGKSFNMKHAFLSHVATHNLERFQCEICGLSLKSRHGLQKHMDCHTGIKRCICDICGKKCRNKQSFKQHILIHTDTLPYACSVCGKNFRNSTNRKRHMLQHSGAMPYSCNICFREFRNLANRNKHVRRRHGIELAKKRLIKTDQVPGETTEAENIQN